MPLIASFLNVKDYEDSLPWINFYAKFMKGTLIITLSKISLGKL